MKLKSFVYSILVGWIVASTGSARAEAPEMTAEPLTAPEKKALAEEFESALKGGLLEMWYPRCVDQKHGGFLCDFDYRWRPIGPHHKMLQFQARQTWVASKAAMRYPDDPRYQAAARHGFRFLRDVQWDKEHGGWFWMLDRQGNPKDIWEGAKHAYGMSFGIYACSAYYEATRDREGLNLAQEAFAWLEEHAHDEEHGGYYEFYRRDGARIVSRQTSPVPDADRDAIGTHLGLKSMNSHIHLMEALTELLGVWPDPLVKQRLREIFLIVRDRIIVPPGAMHLFFHPDWTPIPDHDSYGHDVETGFLLLEAAQALGLENDARTRRIARSLVDHALDYGWDKKHGGFYYGGSTFGEIFNEDKAWWVQAEGLNALLLMAHEFPKDRATYEARFRDQWNYVKRYMIDRKHQGWYPSALDTGRGKKQIKGSPWKASYHTARALMNCHDMLLHERGPS